MIPITESKKQTYSLLDESALKKEAEKLAKSTDSNIKKLGEEILKGLETSFENVNQIIGSISAILVLGLFVTPAIILVIISTLSIMVATLPFELIKGIMKAQISFLRGRLKPEENVKRYYSAVDILLKNETAKEITLESILPVLEAPTEVTPEADDETPADYGEDLAADDTDDEPMDYSDDLDEPEDDTQDDETPEEDDETDDTGEEETPDDDTDGIEDEEPNNYEDDMSLSDDDNMDDTSDDSSDDTLSDDTSTENDEDNIQIGNNRIKNYNLMLQFQKMYKTTEDLIQHLKTVYYTKSIQNSVLNRCFNNISKIKSELMYYIEFNFSRDYKQNLYYYNIFVQSLKLNLEMMEKISKLDEETI